MGELSLRSYQILKVLGRGGTGTVYEALDRRTRAVVALKAVESQVAEHLYRLKHEFRALAEIQHRNLVHFGELVCEDDKWFFTMELVSGCGFMQYVRPPLAEEPTAHADATLRRARRSANDSTDDNHSTDDDEGVVTTTVLQVCGARAPQRRLGRLSESPPERRGPHLDEPRLRTAMAQLVDALSALHQAGHVHRDVKPSNVLVANDGRLVLLDFGLVLALAEAEQSTSDRSGTPAYMAPEQIEGGAVGPEADWYALGTMLHEALTGRLPFPGPLGPMLEAKTQRDAPSPRELAPQVPADLEALCHELTRRDPARRPRGAEIRARLGLPAQVQLATDNPPFVGRRAERKALDDGLAAVLAGGARAALVEGEPGVGKSALVHSFLTGLPAGAVVLSGRCYEQESVPFRGVDSIIDALSAHLVAQAEADIAPLLAGGARYLAAVFPVLNRVPTVLAMGTAERHVVNQAVLREQAFAELAQLLAAIAERHPLVVFLDDLQWIDADSLALLERAVLPGSGTRCLFVATLRGPAEPPPALAPLRARADRIELRGLSADESRALWQELGSTEHGSHRERAMREADGHPLFLLELARAARAGQLDRHAGARLVDVLRDRIGERDELERRLLDVVAVAGAPTPYEILARAAGLDVGECQTRLGALKSAQLVRVSLAGGARCVEPYHDRIREAIIGQLQAAGGDERLHLRLAHAWLDATAPEALRERVFTIVHHLSSARALVEGEAERRRAAGLLLLASREARLATAYKRAHSYARLGLELVGDDAWSRAYALCRDLHLARIEALFLAGDRPAAWSTLQTTRPQLTSPTDTASVWATWVALETGQLRFHEAVAAGREALAELGVRMPARGTLATVLREYVATRWVQARRPAAPLVDLPLLTDEKLAGALALLNALAPPLFFTDTNLLTWMLLRVARLSLRHGVCDVSSYGIAGYGMVLCGAFGEYEEGAAFGELALALDRRFANPELAARLPYVHGCYILPWVRPFAEGKQLLRSAHALAVKHGDTAYEAYASTVLSVLCFCESRQLAEVKDTARWARDIATRRNDRHMASVTDLHARHAMALAGETDSVLELGVPGSSDAELRASLDDATTPIALFYYFFCSADLAYRAGDAARAAELLGEAHRRKEGIFSVPTTVELCLLDALVAARRHAEVGRLERLRLRRRLHACVQQLEVWAESCPENFAAHAHLARAERARVLGHHEQAHERYERAVLAARRHGHPRHEALALELAAAHARSRGEPAETLLAGAVDAYRRWGAFARAEALAGRIVGPPPTQAHLGAGGEARGISTASSE